METKELKIQAPKGYEIDEENSTFECIQFKPIEDGITYAEVCDKIFDKDIYNTNSCGDIKCNRTGVNRFDPNSATNRRQLGKLLALNQLLNIALYYNKLHPKQDYNQCCIICENNEYHVIPYKKLHCSHGVVARFNWEEDAKAVIDNPNFQKILDTIYKY